MSRQALWLSVLLIVPATAAHAQRLPIKGYSTADGLANNTVNRIVRDSSGFLWFCTAGGLSRFDGYAFTNFGVVQGLPSDVTDFLETRGHEYFVATRGGLLRFNPKASDSAINAGGQPSAPDPMFALVDVADAAPRGMSVTVLKEGRDGTVWVGTEDGLYALDAVGARRVLRPIDVGIRRDYQEQRIVADVLEDRNGSLWVTTPSGLYRRWPDGSAARYGTPDGVPHEFLSCLLEDHEGHLWAATRLGGFFRFKAGTDRRAPFVDLKFSPASVPSPGDVPPVWVNHFFETSRHRFWLAAPNGLIEYLPAGDSQGRHFRWYATRNGLTDVSVDTICEDLNGNLWLGTSNGGAMKLADSGLTSYGEREGLQRPYAIFEDRAERLCFRASVLGDAHISIAEGARLDLVNGMESQHYSRYGCFDGEHFDWFTLGWGAFAQSQPGMSDADAVVGWVGQHVTLQGRNGEWWVGTGQGLYRFPATEQFSALRSATPLAVYALADGLAAWQVYRLFEDSHGNIWVSSVDAPTTNGLARWEPESQRLKDLANSPGLPSFKQDVARSFGEDRSGNVWIGFNEALVRYSNGRFTKFTAADGLPPGEIQEIHIDRSGRIWLASDQSGLLRVDQPDARRPVFVTHTTAQGLSGNRLAVIAEDASGHIFAAGGSGLDRFDPATGNVKHFSVADGLSPGTFLAAFRDRRGVLWFGTSGGLTRMVPEAETPPAPPPIWITGLRAAGMARGVSAVGERQVSLPDFDPDQRELQIDFAALSFAAGEVLRYQYRLEGASHDWSVPSERRSVTYASLSPGHYMFEVRAVNSDGMISAQPATVTFNVLRPVWLRAWFMALVACALMATAYALYWYRVRRLLEVVNIRTRIASDLHDDVGANLTRIAMLSEVAQTVPGGDPTEGSLTSIARIARESVSSMSDIVWAIKPERETLLDLTRRMRQHGEELFTVRHIAFRFDAPTDPRDNVTLAVGVRRDVLLMFKEAINNAARHSKCSSVNVSLRLEASRLLMTISDDGGGFDTSRQTDGQGLESMRRRACNMNGAIDITSVVGRGTHIVLTIPI